MNALSRRRRATSGIVLGRARAQQLGVVGQRLGAHDGGRGRRHDLHLLQAHLVHHGAGPGQRRGRRLDGGPHRRRGPVQEEAAQQAHAQPLDVAGERGPVVGHRQHAAAGVGGIVAGHRAQHERAVGGRAGHRPHVVHRPRQRQHPGPAHPAVGGLEAGDAAQRGRDADGAAGVGAERARRQPGRHRDARPRRGASRHAVHAPVPRVAGVSVVRVQPLGAVGELHHVQLAEQDARRPRPAAAATVASRAGTRSPSTREPPVVRTPAVS